MIVLKWMKINGMFFNVIFSRSLKPAMKDEKPRRKRTVMVKTYSVLDILATCTLKLDLQQGDICLILRFFMSLEQSERVTKSRARANLIAKGRPF